MVGGGEITIDDECLRVRGRGLFGLRRKEARVPRASVCNVVCAKKVVRLTVPEAPSTRRTLTFTARTTAEADRVTALLPATRSPRFAQEQTERESFQRSLASLNPRTWVTYALLALNVCAFIATLVGGVDALQPDSGSMVPWGTNFGPYTLDGQWWRLLSSMFLHFGVLHLALNMLGLWSLGVLTERLYGSAAYFLIYLLAGLSGSLASLWWHPLLNSAGASGAIFGVLGALLAFMVNPRTRIPAHIASAQRNSALAFIGYNLLNGATHAGIDNAAHIGGLLAGVTMGWLLARPLDARARSDGGRRVALGALLGAIVLAAPLWRMAYPPHLDPAERVFRHEFLAFERGNLAALQAQAQLDRLRANKQLDVTDLDRHIEQDLEPRWLGLSQRWEKTSLPQDSPLEPLRATVIEYLRDQQTALLSYVDANRNHAPEAALQARQAFTRADERAATINTLSKTLY